MTVERFSKEAFEKVLPADKKSKKPMWKADGLVQGEYQYSMDAPNNLVIKIRSSVLEDGRAAAANQNSIRVWVVTKEGKPFIPFNSLKDVYNFIRRIDR